MAVNPNRRQDSLDAFPAQCTERARESAVSEHNTEEGREPAIVYFKTHIFDGCLFFCIRDMNY